MGSSRIVRCCFGTGTIWCNSGCSRKDGQMRNLKNILELFIEHGIVYERRDYKGFITIDVYNKSYDFKANGKLIGIYERLV